MGWTWAPTSRTPAGIEPGVVRRLFRCSKIRWTLSTHLEVHPRWQDADQRADSINCNERKAVLVNAKHHLQATGHRLDIFIVLINEEKADYKSIVWARFLAKKWDELKSQSVITTYDTTFFYITVHLWAIRHNNYDSYLGLNRRIEVLKTTEKLNFTYTLLFIQMDKSKWDL